MFAHRCTDIRVYRYICIIYVGYIYIYICGCYIYIYYISIHNNGELNLKINFWEMQTCLFVGMTLGSGMSLEDGGVE